MQKSDQEPDGFLATEDCIGRGGILCEWGRNRIPLPSRDLERCQDHPASSSGVLAQLEENHQETAWVNEATSTLWAKSAGTPWDMSHTLRANSTASFSEK